VTAPKRGPRQRPALNPWTREQESRTCRACGAPAGTQCVTGSGTGAPLPHAARFNDASEAKGHPQRLEEHYVGGGLR
jgi:hypothetical protein